LQFFTGQREQVAECVVCGVWWHKPARLPSRAWCTLVTYFLRCQADAGFFTLSSINLVNKSIYVWMYCATRAAIHSRFNQMQYGSQTLRKPGDRWSALFCALTWLVNEVHMLPAFKYSMSEISEWPSLPDKWCIWKIGLSLSVLTAILQVDLDQPVLPLVSFLHLFQAITFGTRMWANAQRDGRPAEHRWRPLFNAARFGWCPLLDAVQ